MTREEALALEVQRFGHERFAPLLIDQCGNRVGEFAGGVGGREPPRGFHVDTPVRSEAPKHIVHPRPRGDQFIRCRAVQVRSPKPDRSL